MSRTRTATAGTDRMRRLLPAAGALLALAAAALLILDQEPPAEAGDPSWTRSPRAADRPWIATAEPASASPAPVPEPLALLPGRAAAPRITPATPTDAGSEPVATEALESLAPQPVPDRAAHPPRHEVLATRLGWSRHDARVAELRSWIEEPGGRRADLLVERFGLPVAEVVALEVPPLATDAAGRRYETDLLGRPLAPADGSGAAER